MQALLDRVGEPIQRLLAELAGGSLGAALIAAGLLLLLALLGVGMLRLLFGALARRVEAWRGRYLRAVRFQRQDILTEEDTTRIALGVLGLVHWGAVLALAYATLAAVLRLFAPTRGFADRLLGYVVEALLGVGGSLLGYLPKLAVLLVLSFLAVQGIRLARLVFDGIDSGRIQLPGFDRQWASPTFKIVRFLMVVLFVIIAFPYLPGSESPAFRAVSLFLGALAALGSSGAVANVISGIVLTYTRSFQLGDRVQVGEIIGDVIEKTSFVTRLRTAKNTDVTVPNAIVLSSPVVNYSAQAAGRGVVLHTVVTIGYDVPFERVETLLLEAGAACEHALEEPAPFVHQTRLDDFYVHYELNVHTREPSRMAEIHSQLHREIQTRLHRAGIEIASPHLAALRDANAAQLPARHLPPDYLPPAFRLLSLPLAGAVREEPSRD